MPSPAEPVAAVPEHPLGFDLSVLKRQRKLISGIVLAGLALLLALALLVPAKYTASAQLEVLLPTDSQPARASFSDARAVQMVLDKHLIMLKSRDLLEKVYETSGAKDDPALKPAIWSRARQNDTAARVEKFSGMIGVNQLLSSAVIAIQYTSSNPELAASVANTLAQSYLDQSLDRQRADLKSGLDRIEARLSELHASLDDNKARSDSSSGTTAAGDAAIAKNIRDLKTDDITTRQAIAELTRRQDEMRRRYEGVEGEVRIASQAAVPIRPSSLNPIYFLLPGLILLTAAGIFLALLRERLDGSIHTLAQANGVLGVPCAGSIPDFKALGIERPGSDLEDDPYSPYGEAIRALAASLNLVRKSQHSEIVLLSSSEGAAGKSTLAGSLAQYLTLIGRRVLVIDLDWRKQGLLRDQRPETGNGVLDLRSASGSFDLTPRHHPSLGFDYVPAKPGAGDPLRFIAGDVLTGALGSLREKYDVILIDGPSAEAQAEASLLAALADKVLLVVKCGSTKEAAARHALAVLKPPARRRSALFAVMTHTPVSPKGNHPLKREPTVARLRTGVASEPAPSAMERISNSIDASRAAVRTTASRTLGSIKNYVGLSA